jgi:hypothetical protein
MSRSGFGLVRSKAGLRQLPVQACGNTFSGEPWPRRLWWWARLASGNSATTPRAYICRAPNARNQRIIGCCALL